MIWVDAHLSPALAWWISTQFNHPAQPVRDLGLREAKDAEIFGAARNMLGNKAPTDTVRRYTGIWINGRRRGRRRYMM